MLTIKGASLSFSICVTINNSFNEVIWLYSYNNDLVICKDSPDYLRYNQLYSNK